MIAIMSDALSGLFDGARTVSRRGPLRLQFAGVEEVLTQAWARHLTRAVQAARFRAGLLALRGVADRLDAWLAEGNALPEKGPLQDLAAYLGVTREALYRHLSRQRRLVKKP